MKPKRNYQPGPLDDCQTPPYAFDILRPYLPPPADDLIIWEPAAGEGVLVETMQAHGYAVEATDLKTGHDFFEYAPSQLRHRHINLRTIIVTNPPYSLKVEFQARCFELGVFWALLMPGEFLFTAGAIKQYREHGSPFLIIPDKRINFKMPRKGWTGTENGSRASAQFPVAWYTFNPQNDLLGSYDFAELDRRPHYLKMPEDVIPF